ncbi:asparagine synthetase B family protein [Microseira wollei]|uniref:asparagine synthase (glutamine-hydrolyzing) n=1 Tax=Microseira wollei NIES-4236 TaxID=2530354 RepID=A0AAV3X6W1_9CYAN|nr:asparagine synthetase B family protein [Microseira wollei]GET38612.1 asparagine synthase [Microseira wollei NIES-4236]
MKPCHFIGYWGYQKDGSCVWEVNPTEATPEKLSENGIIAAISAGGFSDCPDAWVKVESDRLILGRDPFGRVPLYWTQVEQVIWFSSQFQQLLPIIKSPQVSIPALYGYSCFSYIPTPLSPVENIFAIPAGTELIFQGKPLKYTRRRLQEWREAPELIRDENLAVSQLQILLKDAIYRQISELPDSPVGVFLSGGIDSSVVAALLVQAGIKVRAYALDFGNDGYSELPYAEIVARYLDIPLVKVAATPKELKGAIAATAQALDIPFGDGVTTPLYLLNRVASQETAVIFNGENGDQLFAGWTNKPLIAGGIYNGVKPIEDFNQQYLRTFGRLYGYEAEIFSDRIYNEVQNLNPQSWLEDALDPSFCPSFFQRLRRATLMLKGAQNIQPRATNLSFACGLWVRSPFCDLPLTEWTFQLSGELCLQGACEKYILKRAVESWLPPEIVWREKRGMGVPLKIWYFNQLWSEIGQWLNPGVLRDEGRWQPHIAANIIAGKLGEGLQTRYIGNVIWMLIMWQAWRRSVLGEKASGQSLDHPFWLPPQVWKYGRRFLVWEN